MVVRMMMCSQGITVKCRDIDKITTKADDQQRTNPGCGDEREVDGTDEQSDERDCRHDWTHGEPV